MLDTLKKTIVRDPDYPQRQWEIKWREAFLLNEGYNGLKYEFWQEQADDGAYIALSARKPCVMYGLPTIIVQDTTSLVFSDTHFPAIEVGEEAAEQKVVVQEFFVNLFKETKLQATMLDAAIRGSVGSIAVLMRVLKGRFFFEVMSTEFLTPEYDPEEPDVLLRVTEKYKVLGKDLRAMGYTIRETDMERWFWWSREFNRTAENWFLPWPVKRLDSDGADAYPEGVVDTAQSKTHRLGFTPIAWCKNLPGGFRMDNGKFSEFDGFCTFERAIPNSIRIDYMLSQGGRGLDYTQDPTLLMKVGSISTATGDSASVIMPDGNTRSVGKVKGAANALVVGPEDDAKLLEISGNAVQALLAYVGQLREVSLELCGGNRTSPEKLSGAQSGRAMELMNQGLIWLASKLRTTYGDGMLAELLRMVLKVNQTFDVRVGDKPVPKGTLPPPDKARITLKWPKWYEPTYVDHQAQAQAIAAYRTAGVLSRETAVHAIAHDFDVEDVQEEIERLDQEKREEADANLEQQTKLAQLKPQPLKGANDSARAA